MFSTIPTNTYDAVKFDQPKVNLNDAIDLPEIKRCTLCLDNFDAEELKELDGELACPTCYELSACCGEKVDDFGRCTKCKEMDR